MLKTTDRQKNRVSRHVGSGKVGAWEWDLRDNRIWWSNSLYEICQVPENSSITFKTIQDLIIPESREEYISTLKNALQLQEEYDLYFKIQTKDSIKYLHIIGHPILNDSSLIKMSGVIMDVTEEIEVDNKLFKEKEMIDSYVLFSTTDLDGVITNVSSAFCKLSGYTKEELIGLPHSIVRDPEYPNEVYKNLWETITQDKPWDGIFKNISKDGKSFWIEAHIEPIFENGKKIGYRSLKENITNKKMLEKEIKQRKIMLMKQSKSATMGEMIAAISHQIKQPLNIIALLLANLSEDYAYEEIDQAYVQDLEEKVMKQVSYMSGTIDQFRKFLAPNKHQAHYNLDNCVENVLSLMERQLRIHSIEIFKESTDVSLFGVAGEMEQVLLILINNGKDAIVEKAKGCIQDYYIKISALEEKEFTTISIEDNGGGIPEEIINKVFDPYFSTKGEKGTGIGLYMTKMILKESIKGDISVENSSEGAKFIIKLENN